MGSSKAPRSLRPIVIDRLKGEVLDGNAARRVTVGCLVAVASITAAEAQQPPSNAGTIQAGAAYHVEGIDLGAEGKITDKWSVYTGLVLMNNRVDASAVPTNVGLPLAFIANQSFNVLTKYKVNQYLEVGGQATYRSKIYG